MQKRRKKKKKIENEKNEKNERQEGVKKTKSELAREKKKEAVPYTGKKVRYLWYPQRKTRSGTQLDSLISSRNWR